MDLKKIIKNKKSLNLNDQQQRLILIALINSKFNIERAHKLNCPNNEMTLHNYKKLLYKHFSCGIREIRVNWNNRNKS